MCWLFRLECVPGFCIPNSLLLFRVIFCRCNPFCKTTKKQQTLQISVRQDGEFLSGLIEPSDSTVSVVWHTQKNKLNSWCFCGFVVSGIQLCKNNRQFVGPQLDVIPPSEFCYFKQLYFEVSNFNTTSKTLENVKKVRTCVSCCLCALVVSFVFIGCHSNKNKHDEKNTLHLI